MPGIFLGAAPVNPAMLQGISAVYVGDQLVWPTGSYTKNYGSKWGRGDWYNGASGTVYNSSNPNIKSATPAGTGYGSVDWGISQDREAIFSQVNLTGNNGQRLLATAGFVNSAGAKNIISTFNGGSVSTYVAGTRRLVSLADDDGFAEEYIRFTWDNRILFATTDGWSVNRSANGKFDVTAPFPIQKCVLASIETTGANAGYSCGQVQNITDNSFQVTTWSQTSAGNFGVESISVMVVKA